MSERVNALDDLTANGNAAELLARATRRVSRALPEAAKHWDITTTVGEQHNPTEPEVRRINDRVCHPNEGYGGFDIDVIRYFTPVGANTESREPETFSTTYTPSDTVICTNPDYVDE